VTLYEKRLEPCLDLVEELAASGLTNEDIADRFNIPERKFVELTRAHTELARALRAGRRQMALAVESTLYGLAVGDEKIQTVEIRKKRVKVDEDDEGNPIYKLVVNEKIFKRGPNIEAVKYYLENRESGRWKRNPNIEIDEQEVNSTIMAVKELMTAPVPVRSEEDWD